MSTLINLITFFRILIAISISLLIIKGDNYFLILILFFFAGLSDYFDGFFARKYNATSEIGEILDPIADKILIIFVLVTLSVNLSSYILAFSSCLIISREIWVSALRDYCSRKNILGATKVTYLAKVKTSVQLFTIFLYLVALAFNKMTLILIADIFMILAVFITLYTGYEYTLNVLKERQSF